MEQIINGEIYHSDGKFVWDEKNIKIYDKCMRLADDANKSYRGIGLCPDAAYWIDVWNDYSKGKIDEESVKARFIQNAIRW